jgi:hypothetical protein
MTTYNPFTNSFTTTLQPGSGDAILKIAIVGAGIAFLMSMTYRKVKEPRYIEELIDQPINRGREGDSHGYFARARSVHGHLSQKETYDAEIAEFYRRVNDREYDQVGIQQPIYRTNNDVLYRNFIGYNSV